MPTIPPPVALSLVVADQHLADARTGQDSLIGIMGHIHAAAFPVMVPRLCIFAELTNGRGLVRLSMRVIDADEQRVAVFAAECEVHFPDPLAISQISLSTGPVNFPMPGEYRVQVLCESEILLERRLVLLPAQRQTGAANNP